MAKKKLHKTFMVGADEVSTNATKVVEDERMGKMDVPTENHADHITVKKRFAARTMARQIIPIVPCSQCLENNQDFYHKNPRL